MNTEVGVWLGIAVIALIWANLGLWHTRRVLSRPPQIAPKALTASPRVLVPAVLSPSALAPQPHAPAGVTHPTSPVVAS